ncbi:MAG TPA: FG-GAP-like repeat-containing protein [Verrucomicrobiae bacterium]|nr:FG-GAP-like repeat-containing protein [Verrucomicrobiae bacterium]
MQKRLTWIVLCVLVLVAAIVLWTRSKGAGDPFIRSMTMGQGYFEKGDAADAITAYQRAVKLAPESLYAHLNLANAYLLGGQSQEVIAQCQEALNLDHNNPAAYYLMGCAYLRLDQADKAVQALQESQKIDPAITALNFQLGLAQERLGHIDDAIQEFETVAQFQPDHPSVHYQLSRLYQQTGQTQKAAEELAKHQQILAKNPNVSSGPATFERCKYTQPAGPFALDQPERHGAAVHFSDATSAAFGQQANLYHGPLGVLDYNHDGRDSLFVTEADGFRLLENSAGHFTPLGPKAPGTPGAVYQRCLVGDLNNDRVDDVLILGEQASHAFKFATNGQFREMTAAAGLKNLKAKGGLLADLDFTGKLDLLAVQPAGEGLLVYRNLGNGYFLANTNSGLPAVFPGLEQVAVEDWRDEDVPGVFATRAGQPPVYFAKQRAGLFVQTNLDGAWPAGSILAIGDLNNDLRLDAVVADSRELHVIYGGMHESLTLPLNGFQTKGLLLIDYDNDGWLDVLAYGDGLRLWRNLGKKGFKDVTAELGLDKLGPVDSVAAADFDQDGDTDLVVSSPKGLQFLRNDGGNANKQLKLQLAGNRSNPSALGVRVELVSGHWHTIRTRNQFPLEIGVGKHDKIEVLKVRWFDLATALVDVPVQKQPLALAELTLPTGSCPYLYAWDGRRFRFVTDVLGASPLGLPASQTRYIDADPQELLELGDDAQFPPNNGFYEVRLTEELREVLYLDVATLIAVDHPAGTLVHPTSKMLPAKPFLPHELWTLRPVAALQQAVRSDGCDVTRALAAADGDMVSPVRLREPQLRGLAEPFSVTMDFGELPVNRPLVLVIRGWLRFGGGMANVAASLDPALPFPFPTLEAQLPDGSWQAIKTPVGAPAGKTKTILIDLEGKLPPGARRLRLSTAFEIYWDYASLCEKAQAARNRVFHLHPVRADLHWHGFGQFEALPEWLPLTPIYDKAQFNPPWRRTPSGWCTRYGPVGELAERQDNELVLLNGGDELALSFSAAALPPKPEGFARDFFLYVVGWDKDADFHVGQGWRVDPLPFVGLDDQAYGHQARPGNLSDAWISKYNTRWVGPLILARNPGTLRNLRQSKRQ